MKVYVRTYKVQIVLIIMGALMCMSAAAQYTTYNQDRLFLMGAGVLGLGIIGWLGAQLAGFVSSRPRPPPGHAELPSRKMRAAAPPPRGRF